MRIVRSVFSLMFIVAAALGSPVLVSGCSSSSSLSGIQVEANQKEQQLLHDQIHEGLGQAPVDDAPVSEVSRRLGQPLLQKIVQVACQKTWMERLGDLRFTWFLPIRRLQ